MAPRETPAKPEVLTADKEKRSVLVLGLGLRGLLGGIMAGNLGFTSSSCVIPDTCALAGLRQAFCQGDWMGGSQRLSHGLWP